MNKQRINRKGVALFCIILVLVLIIIYGGLRILESAVFNSSTNEQDQSEDKTTKTVTIDGVDYFPRQDITVMLLIGVDKFGPVESSNFNRNDGDADMVALLIFDEKNSECDVLYLNRDTMLTMPAVGIGGKPAGTTYGQLALAHTYGTGLSDSCELTKIAVSDFLNGVNIDYYLSMNMDAISILNDAVGGVTVNVVDDFSSVDPTITMGEMKLSGEQALVYVRSRQNVADQKNVSRIERQKDYIQSFIRAFHEKQNSGIDFALSTYEKVSDYIVTDCSVNTFSNLMSKYKDYEIKEIVTPEGENILGDMYYEFHADEEKLLELVIELFYAPK